MLTKAQNKHIRSLTQHKNRAEHKVFVAEGEKIANEWLRSDAEIEQVIALQCWAEDNGKLLLNHPEAELFVVKESELDALSGLQTANEVLLVVRMPQRKEIPLANNWYLALDDIQDPGNMGTIIRIADWFGIPDIICSAGCVDVYNPKVVQSAMGGHLRVNIYESDLAAFLTHCTLPKYAATLDGESIYKVTPPESGVLIIGNESKGISAGVMALADRKIMIPRRGGAESLNAGVSAGILCALLLPH